MFNRQTIYNFEFITFLSVLSITIFPSFILVITKCIKTKYCNNWYRKGQYYTGLTIETLVQRTAIKCIHEIKLNDIFQTQINYQ